jgi:amidase
VQIVGPWLEDRAPLKLAELIEREFGGFVPPLMFDGLELFSPVSLSGK